MVTMATTTRDISSFPWIKINEIVIVLLIVASIWHRYVTDNNYIVWELNWIDTLIPFGFGILQSFLALSISSQNVAWFVFWIFALISLGVCAYWQLIPKMGRMHSLKLYVEHFEGLDGERIYKIVSSHFEKSRRLLAMQLTLTTILLFLIICRNDNKYINFVITDLSAGPILYVLLFRDLTYKLREFYV